MKIMMVGQVSVQASIPASVGEPSSSVTTTSVAANVVPSAGRVAGCSKCRWRGCTACRSRAVGACSEIRSRSREPAPVVAPEAPDEWIPPDRLHAALHCYFGFRSFREHQLQALKHVFDRQDVLCIAPTGSGKSLCFQLPALLGEGIVVVISPLISLMQNQTYSLNARAHQRGCPAIAAFLGEGQLDASVQPRALRGDFQLVYMTPEKLMMSAEVRQALMRLHQERRLYLLAVDEAHLVCEWGSSFRKHYEQIGAFCVESLPGLPRLALTATAPAATTNTKCFPVRTHPEAPISVKSSGQSEVSSRNWAATAVSGCGIND